MSLDIVLPNPTLLDQLTGHLSARTRAGLERLRDHDCSQIEELAPLLGAFQNRPEQTADDQLSDPRHASYDAYFGVERTQTAKREVLAQSTLYALYQLGVDAQKEGSLDALTRFFFLNSLKTIAEVLLKEPAHVG